MPGPSPSPDTGLTRLTPTLQKPYIGATRTNIDVDYESCKAVMQRYHLSTKREAVNLALRLLAAEALTIDDARAMRGSGWEGDLGELRASRVP